MLTPKQEYISLALKLLRAEYLYRECDSPEMDDYDYDIAYSKLQAMENSNPEWVVSWSVTNMVGIDTDKLTYKGLKEKEVEL